VVTAASALTREPVRPAAVYDLTPATQAKLRLSEQSPWANMPCSIPDQLFLDSDRAGLGDQPLHGLRSPVRTAALPANPYYEGPEDMLKASRDAQHKNLSLFGRLPPHRSAPGVGLPMTLSAQSLLCLQTRAGSAELLPQPQRDCGHLYQLSPHLTFSRAGFRQCRG
jgi:hypothetical protein